MTGEPTRSTSEMPPHAPLSSEKLSIHYASLSALFNLLHSILNQELFENHLCNPRIYRKKMVPRVLWLYQLSSEK